jgi:hypothetical protein
MKNILTAFLLLCAFMPFAFAASDCAHTCCYSYNGSWDTDFDDCFHPQGGYDTCVSQCEAQAAAAGPTPPDTTNAQHYNCKVGMILLALLGTAMWRASRA